MPDARRRRPTLRLAAVLLALPVVAAGCAGTAPPVVGVSVDEMADLDDFASRTGAEVGVYVWFQAWHDEQPFDAERATEVARRGALPMLTWEPWVPEGGVDQPQYALDRLSAGEHDAYVTAFAEQVRDWGGPVAVRFLHELNAPHYPWGAGVNGNDPADAVAAWRHVRDVFRSVGADNVVWVWCVDAASPTTSEIAPLYPGDDHVDWVAVDGYNWGDSQPWSSWRSPAEVFGPTFDELEALSDHPVLITETGSAEGGGDKAVWIDELFELAGDRGVRAVVWFDYDKEADWRVSSSPSALQAFREQAADAGGTGDLPPLPHGAGSDADG